MASIFSRVMSVVCQPHGVLELSSMSSARIYDVPAFFFLLKLSLALLDLLCFYMNCRFAVSGSMKKVPGILTGLVEA